MGRSRLFAGALRGHTVPHCLGPAGRRPKASSTSAALQLVDEVPQLTDYPLGKEVHADEHDPRPPTRRVTMRGRSSGNAESQSTKSSNESPEGFRNPRGLRHDLEHLLEDANRLVDRLETGWWWTHRAAPVGASGPAA